MYIYILKKKQTIHKISYSARGQSCGKNCPTPNATLKNAACGYKVAFHNRATLDKRERADELHEPLSVYCSVTNVLLKRKEEGRRGGREASRNRGEGG